MKKNTILVLLLAAVVLGNLFGYRRFVPKATTGEKRITVEVEHLSGETAFFSWDTEAEYLRKALDEQKLVEGTEREYGLWITTVDGESADEGKQEWWGYTVNGDTAAYGVDNQIISDNDIYLFALHRGW